MFSVLSYLLTSINRSIALTDDKSIIVGSDVSCCVQLKSQIHHGLVSRKHAEFSTQDHVKVRDLNSTNGVFVNGQRIGTHWVELNIGDKVGLSKIPEMTFTLRKIACRDMIPANKANDQYQDLRNKIIKIPSDVRVSVLEAFGLSQQFVRTAKIDELQAFIDFFAIQGHLEEEISRFTSVMNDKRRLFITRSVLADFLWGVIV